MPDWPSEIRAILAGLNLDPTHETEVVEELSQHLQDRYEEMLTRGTDANEAYQTLKNELSNGPLIQGLKATVRKACPPLATGKDRNELWFAGLWNDLRYSIRQLRLNPGFAIIAILSLALGIGANTTIFQLLDAVRLRTLPVKNPEQLAVVRIADNHGWFGMHTARYSFLTSAIWEQIRKQQQAFSDMAAWSSAEYNLNRGGEVRNAETLLISGNYFQLLGIQPAKGRLISSVDDYRGCGNQVAVISYSFWRRNFGGLDSTIGNKLTLNGHPFQIIGVTPPSFSGLDVGHTFDVAVPLCAEPVLTGEHPWTDAPATWWLAAIGRLKPGWTLKRASAELAAISPGIAAATVPSKFYAESRADYLKFHLGAFPAAYGVSWLRWEYESPLWMLLALSGLVLLIACANLANLMLARSSARQREMALRLTLGASRTRLIRQLFTESLLLAVSGTIAGALIAQFLGRVLVASLSTQQERVFFDLSPDWRVFGFTAGLAIVTCVLFGIAPAIQASRTDPGNALKASGRSMSAGRERFLMRRALVVSQVALSLVLVAGAMLFVRTFRNLIEENAGFTQDHILLVDVNYSSMKLSTKAALAFDHDLLSRIRAIPGVASAAEVSMPPLSGRTGTWAASVPGKQEKQLVRVNEVSSGYFQTMGTAFLAGRDFNESDTLTSPKVAIVNREFAKKMFGGANPIGRVFGMPQEAGQPDEIFQIVGLVEDTKYDDLRADFQPIVFFPASQDDQSWLTSTFAVRSYEPMPSLVSSIKQMMNSHPAIELNFTVFKTQVRDSLVRERLMATLSGFFGVLATMLAMVGLYGVMSYMVVRRRNEIGIRMALGADRKNILTMVLREAAALLLIGLAIGTGLALIVGNTARAMLYGLKPHDPLTLSTAILALAIIALLASLLPAQRASSVDPMVALREE